MFSPSLLGPHKLDSDSLICISVLQYSSSTTTTATRKMMMEDNTKKTNQEGDHNGGKSCASSTSITAIDDDDTALLTKEDDMTATTEAATKGMRNHNCSEHQQQQQHDGGEGEGKGIDNDDDELDLESVITMKVSNVNKDTTNKKTTTSTNLQEVRGMFRLITVRLLVGDAFVSRQKARFRPFAVRSPVLQFREVNFQGEKFQ